jgi:hypothetical protein
MNFRSPKLVPATGMPSDKNFEVKKLSDMLNNFIDQKIRKASKAAVA